MRSLQNHLLSLCPFYQHAPASLQHPNWQLLKTATASQAEKGNSGKEDTAGADKAGEEFNHPPNLRVLNAVGLYAPFPFNSMSFGQHLVRFFLLEIIPLRGTRSYCWYKKAVETRLGFGYSSLSMVLYTCIFHGLKGKS